LTYPAGRRGASHELPALSNRESRQLEILLGLRGALDPATGAAERWVGYESLENSMKKQFESTEENKGTSRERVITVHKSGEVAWWSELWDWKGKAQGQPFALEGMRLTGV
jgi:hypothetical protein